MKMVTDTQVKVIQDGRQVKQPNMFGFLVLVSLVKFSFFLLRLHQRHHDPLANHLDSTSTPFRRVWNPPFRLRTFVA